MPNLGAFFQDAVHVGQLSSLNHPLHNGLRGRFQAEQDHAATGIIGPL